MTRPFVFELKQLRGQWVAEVTSATGRRRLGQDRIAVLRDWNDGKFRWGGNPPMLSETSAMAQEEPAWWMKTQHAKWRELLAEGAAVWVREAIDDATQNGSVGRSKGVWRIANVRVDERRLALELVERLGEKK